MEELLMKLGVAVLSGAAYDSVKSGAKYILDNFPHLKEKLNRAIEIKDDTLLIEVVAEIKNEINIAVKSGSILIDGATLNAINAINIDHEIGNTEIKNSQISSKTLHTGGLSSGSTGKTVIGENTSMASSGTEIQLGKGCSIVMTGNASIKQT